MRIRKAMAVLFSVVLMAGILPTRIFAESTVIDISHHTAGNLSDELSKIYASGCQRDQVTSITVSGGDVIAEITADDWSALFSAVISSNNHITTMNLSGTTTSAPVPSDMFSCQTNLTSVTLPSGSYSISDRVFSGCTGLTTITMPDTVTSIGYAAFSDCKSLKSFSIPASVTSIGEDAFSGCENLSSITGNIVSFGKEIFCGCTHLSSITIPSTVTAIGDGAFKNCADLSTITIPQSVTSIGNEAFEGCTHLSSVTFDGTPNITKIGHSAFEGDTSLNPITIPAKVTTIDYRAFYGCTNLKSVIMNADHTISIHNTAFQNTGDNAVLTVPHGSESAWDTSGHHSIQLGGIQFKIENLPPMLHYHINRVSDTEIIINISSDEAGTYGYAINNSDKVSTIDTVDTPFDGTGGWYSATIHKTGLSAGQYKLYVKAKDIYGNMTADMNAQTCINIEAYCPPASIVIINHTAGKFGDKTNEAGEIVEAGELSNAMTDAHIPTKPVSTYNHYDKINNLTVSGGAFNDADWQALAHAQAPDGNGNIVNMVNVQTVDLSGVSSTFPVPNGTFQNFSSLTSIVLPSGITGLGREAFSYCKSLASITIPGNVTSIDRRAFERCSSLASITIPNSVTSIGSGALSGCSSLSSITSLAATPPVLADGGSDFFSDLPSTGTLTVPSGSTAAYTSAWGSYLPEHWTITAAGSPAPNGGGASSGNSAYNANVSGSGSQTTLPITVDAGSKTASFDLGSQSFSQTGTIITVPSIPNVHTYSAKLPVSDLSTSASKGTLTVKTDNGSITIPSNMLTSGASGSKASISIGGADKSALPANVQAAIGDHPLIQLSMAIDGKQTEWNNPNAPVTVSIPYKPTAAELKNPEGIVIWYIDGSGKAVSVPSGHYDPATGTVTFKTTHFSDYAVAYHPVSFTDISAGAWYYDAVSFAAARGIAAGTDSSHFSPNAALTRGQFLVMLMQTYGIPGDEKPTDNFTDAGSTYYTGYLAAAKKLGITTGVGNNLFAPEKGLTRQEMATLLYNMLKTLDKLPKGTSGKALSDFTDSSDVSAWAKDAMTALVKAGIVTGSGGKISPTTATTRAQTAQILYALLTK